jgi:hypothetical protein
MSDITTAVKEILRAALPSYPALHASFPTLKNIAATRSLKLWHTYMTLRMFYQDLYYSRLNDRYQAKMNLYQDEEIRALTEARTIGFGVVFDPIPQAVAPGFATVTSSDPGGTMYLAVSYVNSRNEEGLASEPVEADTQDGNAVDISLTTISDNGAGWNLYAGLAPDCLAIQNSSPIDPLAAVNLAPGRITPGARPGPGQLGNLLYPMPRRLLRG